MKQTAVEWLFDTLSKKGYLLGSNGYFKTFKEAKAMEKEQKIEAYLQGSFDDGPNVNKAEQYYNETYGQGSNDTTS